LTHALNKETGFRLDGKAAVVTGAGSGIGRGIAKKFALHGASVRIFEINPENAEATRLEIASTGGDASVHILDVSDGEQVANKFSELFAREQIHILVNNAGVSHIGNVENTSETEFERIYRINVKSVYNCIRASIGHMKSMGGGVILNMASIAGSSGLSDRFAYSVSKGAVIAMTYSVAKDYLGHGIRCNCISPARIHTPFVDGYLQKNYAGRETEMFEQLSRAQPIGRMGAPAEVATLALFLCSEEASFITGADYPLDGGYLTLR